MVRAHVVSIYGTACLQNMCFNVYTWDGFQAEHGSFDQAFTFVKATGNSTFN
jgi:hypothetical protein